MYISVPNVVRHQLHHTPISIKNKTARAATRTVLFWWSLASVIRTPVRFSAQSRIHHIQCDLIVVSAVVVGQDQLVIVQPHRVYKGINQPLLIIGVVRVSAFELRKEE